MSGEDVNIIDTGEGAKDGQTKCPKCGATDISLDTTSGMLRCNFCRHSFQPVSLDDMATGVGDLEGERIGTGAIDIDESADETVTMKCTSCGAEVVINLSETSQARCHWCRNMLSINSKVPNGTVPDVVLPFKMKKDEARQHIEEYVYKRKFFANKTFKSEFNTDNIMGVYFPYMLIDLKAHASFTGEGEIKRGSYTRSVGDDDTETIYKVESFNVHRECDVEIDDLAVESNARRASASTRGETNNIINAILPFDTENCVKYDANYLKGFSSEKRDVNKSDLQPVVDSQEKEAIKFALNDSVSQYDRGVRWDDVRVSKSGEKWLAAYLPVWLYSYVQNAGQANQLTHYVAVNARTAETVGSVPLNKGRIWPATIFAAILAIALAACLFFIATPSDEISNVVIAVIAGIIAGVVTYTSIHNRYRNTGARHYFEYETKINISNIDGYDNSLRRFETSNSSMSDANNNVVHIERIKEN